MNRTKIIQHCIDTIQASSYLEIGIDTGTNFKQINCNNKTSVDPAKGRYRHARPTHMMTSDEFFAQNEQQFDVILIDGMHEADYVERDINNSIACLNDNGYIVCHDMNPKTEEAQIVPRATGVWNGDCWKAWVRLRCSNPGLRMFVVNTDYGCGVIQKGTQQLLDTKGMDLTYENFDSNRVEWLNLIDVDQLHEYI